MVVLPVPARSEHARKHALVTRWLGTEGEEVQAVLLDGSVGNASAVDLQLFPLALDLHAGDVRGRRFLGWRQFGAVLLRSSDYPFLLLDGKLVECREMMHPAHGENVAASLAWLPRWNECDIGGAARRRVRGAVDEPRDIAPAPIGEP